MRVLLAGFVVVVVPLVARTELDHVDHAAYGAADNSESAAFLFSVGRRGSCGEMRRGSATVIVLLLKHGLIELKK